MESLDVCHKTPEHCCADSWNRRRNATTNVGKPFRTVHRWSRLRPASMITAHGELDASNATSSPITSRAASPIPASVIVDLSSLEFFGTAGFSALHLINVRCAAADLRWAVLPGKAVSRLLRSAIPTTRCRWFSRCTPRPMQTPTILSRAGYSSSSRSRARDLASNRETCIWEMPTRSAICVCVIESKNRRTNTVRPPAPATLPATA